GSCQLGWLGSGKHFGEVGEVEEIIDQEVAEAWGISPGQLYVLIHSGSRGFGHQVCTDTIEQFLKLGYGEGLPDRQLVSAPFKSSEGQGYFHAMAAAANYAFNNRQQILHSARKVFSEVLGIPGEEIALLYDVCHNIAKVEKHRVDGRERSLCVHRKGATRALGRGSDELVDRFKQTGQPVLVPGDMGRASYIMVGEGNPLTFCSACHGAGRARSRHESMRAWKGRDPMLYMRERGVRVKAHSLRTVTEEMPDAYKEVDLVVMAVEQAKLARRVARLHPRLVIKG
ncbi:MAG: RtcB family protein, partial [Chlamydiia bacterium]|nr:RtcB family protein [Chlamydiia bacterium]